MANNHTPPPVDVLSQQLVQIAAGAAHKVGDMLVEGLAQATAGHVSIEEKASIHDLVTRYDRESERLIVDYILQHHPDSTIMGEEQGARGNGRVRWYVDPIDGTSNFAAGIPFFCVSIGAVVNNQIVAGVIYDPIRRELFSATTGGAFLNGNPIRSRGHTTESKALLLTAFPSAHAGVGDEDFKRFSEMVTRFATVRRIGSAALSLAYVACGRADVVYEPSVNPWDVTAGMFIIEQAGGRYLAFGPENGQTARWMLPKCIATCPQFDLENSVMHAFLHS